MASKKRKPPEYSYHMYYTLDSDHRPVACDFEAWAKGQDESLKRVGWTETKLFIVSTVFLGLDHNYSRRGQPILFETMTFERQAHIAKMFGELMAVHEDIGCLRYCSWDDALAGHETAVRRMLYAEQHVGIDLIEKAVARAKESSK